MLSIREEHDVAITRTEKSVSKPISTPKARSIKWKELLGKLIVYLLLIYRRDHLHCTLGLDGFCFLPADRGDF